MNRPTVFVPALGLLLVIAGVAGYRTAPRTAHPNAIRLDHGIPVGVLDTPRGAIAAADNYLASEDNALLSAAQLRAVVSTDWAPRDRPVELAQPTPSAALHSTPAALGDARLTAAVVADKLEAFTPPSARVAVWHEVTVWSSGPVASQPAQHWLLDTVTLVWDGRWRIASRATAPDPRTPVPSLTPRATAATASAFTAGLAGMSAPYYGDGPEQGAP